MKKSGFTLFEMSIVIVIIGLIVGGVMTGKSMIRSAQLRAVVSEYDSYLKAIKEFQDKYQFLPGDFTNATTFWGTDGGGCPTPAYSVTPKITTCNGDGDGRIGSSTTTGSLSNSNEWWRAWQHLNAAGFLQAAVSGTQGSGGTTEADLDVNVPSSQLTGAGWTLNYFLMTTADTGLWRDQYGHVLNFGAPVAGDYTKGAILSPAEALGIDQKIDDGLPGTGKVRAWRTSVLQYCTGNDTSQTAQTYSNLYTGQLCSLVFLTGF